MAEEASGKDKNAPESSASGNNMLLMIIAGVALLLLIIVGVLAFMLLSEEKEEVTPEMQKLQEIQNIQKAEALAEAFKTEKAFFFSLDPFIVNLTDTDEKHYLKAVIELEVRREDIMKELQSKTPQIRDTILFVLTNKAYDEVNNNEGKSAVKHELLVRINQLLNTGGLEMVYLMDFVVQ